MTKVRADISATINLNNFNSTKISLGVEDDTKEGESVEEGLQRVFDTVDELLSTQVQQVYSSITK